MQPFSHCLVHRLVFNLPIRFCLKEGSHFTALLLQLSKTALQPIFPFIPINFEESLINYAHVKSLILMKVKQQHNYSLITLTNSLIPGCQTRGP